MLGALCQSSLRRCRIIARVSLSSASFRHHGNKLNPVILILHALAVVLSADDFDVWDDPIIVEH